MLTMARLKCRGVRRDLDEYRQSTLSHTRREAVRAHLQRCTKCREVYLETERVLLLVGAAEPFTLPEHRALDFAAAVRRRIAARSAPAQPGLRAVGFLASLRPSVRPAWIAGFVSMLALLAMIPLSRRLLWSPRVVAPMAALSLEGRAGTPLDSLALGLSDPAQGGDLASLAVMRLFPAADSVETILEDQELSEADLGLLLEEMSPEEGTYVAARLPGRL